MTEEHKRKISKANKGKRLGKYHTEETKKKMKKSHTGFKHSLKAKKKMSEIKKGYIPWMKGKKHSEEARKKMSNTRMGYKPTKEHLKNLSKSHIGKTMEKSSNWQGGKSFEPYPFEWTETLRRSIRERDNYVCQMCSELQGDKAHAVHHIDYNKKNCDPNNLITLCCSCHMKTGGKKRNFWINYFTDKHKVF